MLKEINQINGGLRKSRVIHIHPMWYSFIKYCEDLEFGEIEKLKIRDGLPVFAEKITEKIKFDG